MNVFVRKSLVGLVSILAAATVSVHAVAAELDGLVKIKTKKVDQGYLLPGTDFSAYKKVMIAPSQVAFKKNWLRDTNNRSMSLSSRLSDKDAKKIIETARSGFDDIWAEAFKKAGYEVVTAPGDDVMKLAPSVYDLYINAPETSGASPTRTYVMEAGEATLSLEVRDSVSGTLLGVAVDQRTAGINMGRVQIANKVTNRSDFGQLFKSWAKVAADGLSDLAQASPLPETLEPNKKLPKQ